MTTKTNPTPPPLTDDSEVWKRTLSILAALKQVASEVRDEAYQIEAAYPGQLIKPGYADRVDLITTLNGAYDSMTADTRSIARHYGLTMPEDLR